MKLIFTDGGYNIKYGVGAWACLVIDPIRDKILHEVSGAQRGSTSNRCELKAIIESLDYVEEREEVHIATDSMYCIIVLRQKKKEFPLNMDLINEFRQKAERKHLNVRFHHIKGHNGNPWNEKCDKMCSSIINKEKAKR